MFSPSQKFYVVLSTEKSVLQVTDYQFDVVCPIEADKFNKMAVPCIT